MNLRLWLIVGMEPLNLKMDSNVMMETTLTPMVVPMDVSLILTSIVRM